jgi:hypothetical protein
MATRPERVTTACPGANGEQRGSVLSTATMEVTSRRSVSSYSRGVEVSEVFHDAGGGLGGGFHAGTDARAQGPDPEGRSYGSYAYFSDPDGNGWLLQEITERLPGGSEGRRNRVRPGTSRARRISGSDTLLPRPIDRRRST